MVIHEPIARRPLLAEWHRWRGWLVIGAALLVVGGLVPFFYVQLAGHGWAAAEIAAPLRVFSAGSGSLLTLRGTAGIGLLDPLVLGLLGFIAVGGAITVAVADRRRSTQAIGGHIGRRRYLVLQARVMAVVATMVALMLLGLLAGAAGAGVLHRLNIAELPLVFLYGFMLWTAFAGFSLAAAVTFERTGWAIGLSAAYLLLNYLVAILSSLWSGAAWAEPFPLFHSFRPSEILGGHASPDDLAVLVLAALVPIGYAMVVLPKRSTGGARDRS